MSPTLYLHEDRIQQEVDYSSSWRACCPTRYSTASKSPLCLPISQRRATEVQMQASKSGTAGEGITQSGPQLCSHPYFVIDMSSEIFCLSSI